MWRLPIRLLSSQVQILPTLFIDGTNGDEMKKNLKIGIFLIIVVIVFLLLMVLVYWGNDNDAENNDDAADDTRIIRDFYPDYKPPEHYHNITRANDTRVVTIIEGKYKPYNDLKLKCFHKVGDNILVYSRLVSSNEEGFYTIIFNRDICRANDFIQVCTIEDNICSDRVNISLAPFSMEYYNSSLGKNSRNIRTPFVAVPEYSTISALILILITGFGIAVRKKQWHKKE